MKKLFVTQLYRWSLKTQPANFHVHLYTLRCLLVTHNINTIVEYSNERD